MVLSLLWVTSNLPIFGQIEIKSTVYLKDGSKLIGTLAKSETSGMYKLSLRNGLQLDVPVSIVRKIIQDEVKAEKVRTQENTLSKKGDYITFRVLNYYREEILMVIFISDLDCTILWDIC